MNFLVITILLLLISSCTPNIEKLKDRQDVKGLIKALGYGPEYEWSEPYIRVREAASDALVEIGEPAVEPLIEALKDENNNVQAGAARTLGEIGDSRAVEPLTEALWDGASWVREAAAEALGEIGEPFIETLGDEDLKAIAVYPYYSFFISLGIPGTEPVLIKALNKYGDIDMAEEFLNCGNSWLGEAARIWGEEHGYTVTKGPGVRGSTWGE